MCLSTNGLALSDNAVRAVEVGVKTITVTVTDTALVEQILGNLRLIIFAESLGGVETLITYPAVQTHASIPREIRERYHLESVFYPGLPDAKGRELHLSQAAGPGCVLSFQTKDLASAKHFMKNVKLAATAVSLGGVETIVSYPVKMSHASVPKEQRDHLGITDRLIRVSVGLEDIDDLLADFKTALA